MIKLETGDWRPVIASASRQAVLTLLQKYVFDDHLVSSVQKIVVKGNRYCYCGVEPLINKFIEISLGIKKYKLKLHC